MLSAVIIKLLYVALVICVVALLAVAGAAYIRVRRHLQQPHAPEHLADTEAERN